MAHTDDGQYELVLENKQVLGIFFAAAILCGIFFGLGFLVGRSSKGNAPSTQPAAVVSAPSPNRKSAMTQADRPPEASTPASTEPAPAEKQVETPKQEEKSAPPPVTPPAPAPAPVVTPAPAAEQTVSYHLQVAAFSTQEEAEPMAALLKRKNFPVAIVPGTTDKLLHVMVGPYPNAKEADVVKKRLENEGFKPIVKK